MRHWKKILLAVVVLLVGAVVITLLSIDGIAMRAVEKQATQTLGVDTSMTWLNLKIFRGEVRLHGLEVANPDGFTSKQFLKLDGGKLDVSMGSLMSDTVNVPSLELTDIEVYLEKKSDTANYEVIMANLHKQDKQDKNAQPGKKFIIQDLVIRNIKVHANIAPLIPIVGGPPTQADVTIPEIHVKNVGTGSDKNGVAIAEVTNVIMKSIFQAIAMQGGGLIPKDIAAGLGEGLAILGVDKTGLEIIGGVTNTAGGVVKGVLDGAGEAAKGIGDLLGGDDKKNESKKDSSKKHK